MKRGKKQSKMGIAMRLLICFLSFTAVTLMLLWFFQIIMLDRFYRSITIDKIQKNAGLVSRNIDNENLDELASRLVLDSDMCLKVIYFSGGVSFEAYAPNNDSVLRSISTGELYKLYMQAQEEGGSCLVTYERDAFRDTAYNFGDFLGPVPRNDRGMSESMVYTLVAEAGDTQAVVYVSCSIYPVDSTVDTLKVQLAWVTAIMVVCSVAMAFALSRVIAGPIVRLNDGAKVLATGDYSIRFEDGGCRELAELGNTLNTAAQELGKVDALKNELIANISHDLRTPLTLIGGYAEMMRDIPGENNAENLQVIIDETARLSNLVSDLLDLSKLRAGTQPMTPSHFCLTDSIRAMLDRCAKMLEQSGYSLVFEPQEDVWVYADELRISQVVYNLVGNAVNYTGEDRTVTVRQITDGESVTVEVSDTGHGIPAEQLPLIWERYYKTDKPHKRAAVSSGLGLSIVGEILKSHSAGYGVISSAGGSTFWFRLPTDNRQE